MRVYNHNTCLIVLVHTPIPRIQQPTSAHAHHHVNRHDMRFDCRYVYAQCVGRMGRALRALEEEEEVEEEGT